MCPGSFFCTLPKMYQYYQIHNIDHGIHLSEFHDVMASDRAGLQDNPIVFNELREKIRALLPEGEVVKEIGVRVKAGQKDHQAQQKHEHPEYTAVFYPDTVQVPIYVEDRFEVIRLFPQAGDVVIMGPGVKHWVGANNTDKDRLSFATLVKPPGATSKFGP